MTDEPLRLRRTRDDAPGRAAGRRAESAPRRSAVRGAPDSLQRTAARAIRALPRRHPTGVDRSVARHRYRPDRHSVEAFVVREWNPVPPGVIRSEHAAETACAIDRGTRTGIEREGLYLARRNGARTIRPHVSRGPEGYP